MKCKAMEMRHREIAHAIYRDMGETFLSFLDVSTAYIVSEMCGFKKKRLQHLFDITNDALTAEMDRMAADGDDDVETAENALYSLVFELKYHGFNYYEEKAATAFVDPFFDTWHSQRQIDKHSTRYEFVQRMDTATDLYYVTLLDYMHNHKGYGAKRLSELYSALRKDFNEFLCAYVGRCDAKGDEQAMRMIEDRQRRCEQLGLTLVNFDGTKTDSQKKPEPIINVPLTVDEFIAAFGQKRYDYEMERKEQELRERSQY